MNCDYCGCLLPKEYTPNCRQCGAPRQAPKKHAGFFGGLQFNWADDPDPRLVSYLMQPRGLIYTMQR